MPHDAAPRRNPPQVHIACPTDKHLNWRRIDARLVTSYQYASYAARSRSLAVMRMLHSCAEYVQIVARLIELESTSFGTPRRRSLERAKIKPSDTASHPEIWVLTLFTVASPSTKTASMICRSRRLSSEDSGIISSSSHRITYDVRIASRHVPLKY